MGIKVYGIYVVDFDGKCVYKINVDGIGYVVGILILGGIWGVCVN